MVSTKLQTLAKALFKKVRKFEGVVTNSLIKKTFPGFLVSCKEHWELLILKLLGRDKNCNLPQDSKRLQHLSKQPFLSSVGLVPYGNPENFAGILSFKYIAKDSNSFFKAEIGYDFNKAYWFYVIRKGNKIYSRSQVAAINAVVKKFHQTEVLITA